MAGKKEIDTKDEIIQTVADILMGRGMVVRDIASVLSLYGEMPDGNLLARLKALPLTYDAVVMITIGNSEIPMRAIQTVKYVEMYDEAFMCKAYYIIVNEADGNSGVYANIMVKFDTDDERAEAVENMKETLSLYNYKFVICNGKREKEIGSDTRS